MKAGTLWSGLLMIESNYAPVRKKSQQCPAAYTAIVSYIFMGSRNDSEFDRFLEHVPRRQPANYILIKSFKSWWDYQSDQHFNPSSPSVVLNAILPINWQPVTQSSFGSLPSALISRQNVPSGFMSSYTVDILNECAEGRASAGVQLLADVGGNIGSPRAKATSISKKASRTRSCLSLSRLEAGIRWSRCMKLHRTATFRRAPSSWKTDWQHRFA